jgi:signal peptidase I
VAAILGMAAIGAWAIMTERISYVVTEGTSMNPVYHAGDLVFVAKDDSYHVGQIAAYHGDTPGQRVLHRIIGGNSSVGFVFRGDNTQSTDPLTPTANEIIGRAVLHVPNGGLWLKPLLGPSGLGMLSFLVVSGGAVRPTRREIPRGRRKKRVKAMARQGGSWGAVAAAVKVLGRLSPLLRAAAAVAVVLTVLALTLGVLGWMKPTVETRPTAQAPKQSITFSYSAKVPKSPAYDDTTVRSPDPIFRKLANKVDLSTRYDGPAGTLNLTATLTNGTGWHTAMTLMKNKSFAGTSYNATVPLDLPALVARADAASEAIGASPTSAVTITLNARITSAGLDDLTASLPLTVTPFTMTLGAGAKLTNESTATAAAEVAVPREIKAFGHAVIMASKARSYAVLALIAAGAIAAVIFLIARRGTPLRTRADIERRYPQLLVPVEPMASPPGKPVVTVDNFPALVRLAERYGQMILTWRRPEADDFIVRDEGITYRYRIPLDEPVLQNIEHINRPTSAGSHRRKASTQVS